MNHMKQVANVLGIELGECFDAVTSSGEVIPDCKISQDGFSTNYSAHDTATLWNPKLGERYYFVCKDGRVDAGTRCVYEFDLLCYKTGNCYRTKEEAEAHAEEWKVFFASDEQVDVLGGKQ